MIFISDLAVIFEYCIACHYSTLPLADRHMTFLFAYCFGITFLFILALLFLPAGSRPPLILQSPPPYAPSPREGGPDQKQQSQQRKKGPAVKEEKDMYDIVSSPNKDSTKLTLKLSRVKSNESDPPGKRSFATTLF